MTSPDFRTARIPLHRSVRMVRFEAWRLVFWGVVSVGLSLLASQTVRHWSGWYGDLVERLLGWAGVPFAPSRGEGLWLVATPSWSVPSYNPAAQWTGALAHGLGALALLVVAVRSKRISFPVAAWLGLGAAMVLLSTLVLFLRPIPRLTPESFSRLWSQVALGTVFLIPWVWSLLVGLLPISVFRVLLWGFSATLVLFVWSACRLALFLALATWLGLVWLPPAFILGCSLPDILVLVTAYSLALEPAGALWEHGG